MPKCKALMKCQSWSSFILTQGMALASTRRTESGQEDIVIL